MKKRLVGIAVILAIVISFIPNVVMANGVIYISNEEELRAMANDLSGNYVLENSISLSGEWDPIGKNGSEPFTGTFNGNGYTISGLQVTDSKLQYVGLFGYIRNAEIKDLEISDCSLSTRLVGSGYYIGAIAGCSDNSVIEDCAITGDVNIYLFSAHYIFGIPYDMTDAFGGSVVGYNGGTIERCNIYADVYVYSDYYAAYAGGVVGVNRGLLSECQFQGNVSCFTSTAVTDGGSGGVASHNYGTISNCCVKSFVATRGNYVHSGGIVSRNHGTLSNNFYCGFLQNTTVSPLFPDKSSGNIASENFNKLENNYYIIAPSETNEGTGNDSGDGTIAVSRNIAGSESTYPSFDFSSIWRIYEDGLPGLRNVKYIAIPTKGTTNSTSSNAPVITSAKLTHSGNTYDIFKDAVTIEEDSDIIASIEATVDNNGCENVKVYVTQGAGKETDITGVCMDLTPGKDFSAGKDIYIMAVDEDTGKSTSKKTKLKVSSTKDGSLGAASDIDGLNFKLGKDVGFTIPDSFPVFGGTEINWAFDFIPITFEYDKEDDNKLNVVIGGNVISEEYEKNGVKRKYFKDLDFKKYKNDISHAARTQRHDLKDLRKYFDKDNGKKKNMNLFGGAVSGSGKGSTGGDIDFMGYAEMKYIDGQWKFVEGVVKLDAEIKYTYEGQIFIWVVPCYYEFGGGAGAGFEGKMIDLNPDSFTPQFEGYLSAKILAEIGGGVGVSGVATAGASGEGSLNIKTALAREYLKSWGEGSASFHVKIFGKTVAEKEFARGDFLIYETGNSKGLIKDKNGIELSSLDEPYGAIDINSVYENESRTYAENPSEWKGDEYGINLAATEYTNRDLKLLAENIYTESAPQICEINGKKVLVTQWDNTDRADIDRTMLVYSVYDDTSDTWSKPVAVDDDGTADFYPCFKDGYLVWQNSKTKLSDNMTLKEIAQTGEICAAKWNGSGFDEPSVITDNNSLDTLPMVAATTGGASVVWVTNTEDDILGITGKNSIMRADFDGTAWGAAKAVKNNLNAVTNITAGMVNDKFCVAYVADDDNDLNTINDRDIRIISDTGEIQLTDNDILDSNPVFVNNMIYYYSDGNIAYSDIDGSNAQTVFAEVKPGLTDAFVVDSNSRDTAIWWTKAENGGAEVYASMYTDGAWSDEIKITDVGNTAKYPSGILNDDGSMVVAFNNGILEDNEVVKTDLYTISVNPSYDLSLTDAYIDEDTMTVYAIVTNSGELAINSYTLTINDNGVNAEKTITEPLKAGESADVEIVYNKPENLTEHDIEVAVTTAEGDEYNTQNNTIMLSVGHADIAVDNVAVNAEENKITADISNTGYTDAENVTVQLRESSADGTVLSEQTISASVNETQPIEFTFDKTAMRFYDSTKQLYITAKYDGEEMSVGNNDGYAVITSPSGFADYVTEILSYDNIDGKLVINSIAENNTTKQINCQLFTAVYSDDGALKGCGTTKANISANDDTGVDISVGCELKSGDTIKAFMWDNQKALSKTAELVIE